MLTQFGKRGKPVSRGRPDNDNATRPGGRKPKAPRAAGEPADELDQAFERFG